MKKEILLLVAGSLLFLPLAAIAGNVYEIFRNVEPGRISGTVETDGTIGELNPSNILSWSFEAHDGTDAISISSASAGTLQGNAWNHLSATTTQLRFDFDGAFADPEADLISFHAQDSAETQTYSFDYNLLANTPSGKQEQLIHQFGTDGQHWIQSSRQGVVVIGTIVCSSEDCPSGSSVLKLIPLIMPSQDEE